MTLNKAQRKIIIVGALMFILMGLFPPWLYTLKARNIYSEIPAGYSLLASPPDPTHSGYMYGIKLDFSRLFVQWLIVITATGLGVFMTRGHEGADEKGCSQGHAISREELLNPLDDITYLCECAAMNHTGELKSELSNLCHSIREKSLGYEATEVQDSLGKLEDALNKVRNGQQNAGISILVSVSRQWWAAAKP